MLSLYFDDQEAIVCLLDVHEHQEIANEHTKSNYQTCVSRQDVQLKLVKV